MSGLDLLLSQRHLVVMLLLAGGVGLGLGLVYDLLGVLRLVLLGGREPTALGWRRVGICLRFVGDLLFALLGALALILLAYYTNDGRLRAPAALGAITGVLVWRWTFGRLLLWLRDRFLFRLMRLCGHVLATPCRLLWRLARWMAKPLVKPVKKLLARLHEWRAHRHDPTPESPEVPIPTTEDA